ncbi:MAG: hypothetical protein IT436_10615 [Phycisphaerales bacterium]|nr:hypothetical protein [Phycisphaerales bacterium]
MKLASVGIALSLLAASGASAQVTNGGFDVGFVASSGQAEVPAPWTSTGPGNPFISFDTWDDSGANGLIPSFAGVFTGVTAHSGHRWAGGWDFENMSQQLSSTLIPGQQYTVSAWVHTADTTFGYAVGGWQFGLGATASSTPAIFAVFPATATWSAGWVFQSATFTAPATSASTPYFFPQVYKPGSLSVYMGIDDVQIRAVPGPGPAALIAAGTIAAIRRRSSLA